MIILSVLALLSFVTTAEGQFLSRFGFDSPFFSSPFSSGFDSIFNKEFPSFPSFPSFPKIPSFLDFGFPDWRKIISAFEKAAEGNGITVVNGTTTITQIIGGKEYNVTLPKGVSYMLHTEKNTINGTTVSVVRLTINNRTAVYKTENGKVTATDGKGNPLPAEDDFFGVNGNPPKITSGPEPSTSPEPRTEAPTETKEANTEAPKPATSGAPEMKTETPAPPERSTEMGTA